MQSAEDQGYEKCEKKDMIQSIIAIHGNKEKYQMIGRIYTESKTRKEPQCPYRLMNILFSDEFSEQFAQIGNVVDRFILDSGKAGNDEHFWEGVQKAVVTQDESYDKIFFKEDDVFCGLDYIDASKIVQHDWKKLRGIWKAINMEYKSALSRFTLSGTHTSNFYDFCNGKKDIYYLRKHLELKPNLTGTIGADLPEDTFIESNESSKKASLTYSYSSKRKRDSGIEIAEALREMNNSKMQAEIAKKKLEILVKQDARKEKEEERKEKEEARKERQQYFEEWEKIQINLRQLRKDMHDEPDKEMKADIKFDIEALMKRKKELSKILNFL